MMEQPKFGNEGDDQPDPDFEDRRTVLCNKVG